MISRNRVPGWLVRAIRVPDLLKSLGCPLGYDYNNNQNNNNNNNDNNNNKKNNKNRYNNKNKNRYNNNDDS